MSSLPLSKDVDVTVNLSPRSLPRNGFNFGIIIGDTDNISVSDRVKGPYLELSEIIDAGFSDTDPEYLAAVAYFAQDGNLGASIQGVYIGRWNTGDSDAETAVQALQACRLKNTDWYGAFICGLTDEEIKLAAAATQSLVPSTMLFWNSSTQSLLDGVESNLFDDLKTAGYRRNIGFWHEDDYFAAGVMGYAMGANTGLAKSAYTLKFKQIIGFEPSDITTEQVNNIEKYYGNVYVQRARPQLEQGTVSDGTWFDEMINLDKLANDIQLNIYDSLYSVPKEDQTDSGQNDLASVINQANEQAVSIGFIAKGGKWRKADILDLKKGDTLPNGYLVLYQSVDLQSDADRDARKAQPLYNCVTLAGAIHSAVIQVNVSR